MYCLWSCPASNVSKEALFSPLGFYAQWCLSQIYQLDDETGGGDPIIIKWGLRRFWVPGLVKSCCWLLQRTRKPITDWVQFYFLFVSVRKLTSCRGTQVFFKKERNWWEGGESSQNYRQSWRTRQQGLGKIKGRSQGRPRDLVAGIMSIPRSSAQDRIQLLFLSLWLSSQESSGASFIGRDRSSPWGWRAQEEKDSRSEHSLFE